MRTAKLLKREVLMALQNYFEFELLIKINRFTVKIPILHKKM